MLSSFKGYLVSLEVVGDVGTVLNQSENSYEDSGHEDALISRMTHGVV